MRASACGTGRMCAGRGLVHDQGGYCAMGQPLPGWCALHDAGSAGLAGRAKQSMRSEIALGGCAGGLFTVCAVHIALGDLVPRLRPWRGYLPDPRGHLCGCAPDARFFAQAPLLYGMLTVAITASKISAPGRQRGGCNVVYQGRAPPGQVPAEACLGREGHPCRAGHAPATPREEAVRLRSAREMHARRTGRTAATVR